VTQIRNAQPSVALIFTTAGLKHGDYALHKDNHWHKKGGSTYN
jgi:hypothetical protein